MPNEKVYIGEVVSLLSFWISKINLANAINFYDINKVSEGVSQQLLNLIFKYNLKDLNDLQSNYPGIDLGDAEKSKVAFQITSRKDVRKIKHSLSLFYAKKLDKTFSSGLKFFILTNNRTKPKFIVGYEGCFNPHKGIIYPPDLVKAIIEIYRTDFTHFENILALLRKEFGNGDLKNLTASLINFKDRNRQIDFYKTAQRFIYIEQLANFVPFRCLINGQEDSTDSLSKVLESTQGIVVIGSSGCGKSLLAKKIIHDFLDNNIVSLFLEAKYYEKSFSKLIDNEIQKFDFSTSLDFFQLCKETNKKILLVIDGLNECSSEKQIKISLELKEILIQHELKFIITTQSESGTIADLNGYIVNVGPPNMETKKSIVGQFIPVTQNIVSILSVIKTSMEARLLGELGDVNTSRLSRFELLELYLRRVIPDNFTEIFTLLSILAEELSKNISFNISIRRIEKIIKDNRLTLTNWEICIRHKLLSQNNGKISFAHEMWLNFFSAADITKQLLPSNLLLTKLAEPKNSENRLFILGAIEDHSILDEVLKNITDSDIIKSLLLGEGGEYCRLWAKSTLTNIIAKIDEEVQNIQFEITKDEYWPVQIKPATANNWTAQEWSFIYALPYLLFKEIHLEELFTISGKMDVGCENGFKQLLKEAQEKKVSLRSGIFNTIYGNNGSGFSKCAITTIFRTLHSGFASFNNSNEITVDTIKSLLENKNPTNGQFFLLLNLCKYDERAKLLYPYIINSLGVQWKYIPYLLKNEILERAGHCYQNEDQRVALINALNQIHSNTQDPFLSTSIFEALNSLGALDDDAFQYEDVVKDQLSKILSTPDNKSCMDEAAGIFYAQFDHPYDIAFQNALAKLSIEESKAFYRMAIQGYTAAIFTCPLIFESVSILGNEICPYLGRFIENPIANKSMPQDSLQVFTTANILLGHFSYPIKSRLHEEEDEQKQILLACGEIYYWINRTDLNNAEKKKKCYTATCILFKKFSAFSIESIWQSRQALLHLHNIDRFPGKVTLLDDFFAEETADCARKSILIPENLRSVFGINREEDIVKHAIGLLECHGDLRDLKLLRQLADHHSYGTYAIKAIKKLENKIN